MCSSQGFAITQCPRWLSPTQDSEEIWSEKQTDITAKTNYPWATGCSCFKVKRRGISNCCWSDAFRWDVESRCLYKGVSLCLNTQSRKSWTYWKDSSSYSMALQDLCNTQDYFLESITTECPSVPFGKKTGRSNVSGLPFRNSKSLFNFYIPIAEYLGESPIQFGQISTIQSSSTISSQDPILSSLALPTNLPLASSQSVPLPFPMSHGTTTLAFIFQGGVLAAADTRSSCSGLVACPASQKILPIHSHLVGTTSGTSADCALWKRILARELRLYQLRHGRRLSTCGAAKLLSHMLHPFKGTELCVAATLCGWDGGEADGGEEIDLGGHRETAKSQMTDLGTSVDATLEKKCLAKSPSSTIGSQQCFTRKTLSFSGPSLYYVCSDGTRLQGKLFSVGSGSPYAYSILDQGVQWGLTLDEATSIAREAVYRATHRDAYSGNCVDIFHISSKGWTRRSREDLKEEYYREKEREERRKRQDRTAWVKTENKNGMRKEKQTSGSILDRRDGNLCSRY